VAFGLRVERRELVLSTVAAAIPEAREASPANSIWPFFAAIATSVMLISSIFTPWAVVWGSLPILVTLIGWFWPKATPEDEA
jgi:cytochrome c oxidase subunit 1